MQQRTRLFGVLFLKVRCDVVRRNARARRNRGREWRLVLRDAQRSRHSDVSLHFCAFRGCIRILVIERYWYERKRQRHVQRLISVSVLVEIVRFRPDPSIQFGFSQAVYIEGSRRRSNCLRNAIRPVRDSLRFNTVPLTIYFRLKEGQALVNRQFFFLKNDF